MCTSFVFHADQTYIGMNFDIAERPIRLSLTDQSRFFVQQQQDAQFLPAFGITRSGAFMNQLSVEPNAAGSYRRAKTCMHIGKLFDAVLADQLDSAALSNLLDQKTIVNVPNFSVHSLITTRDRSVYVVEPGRAALAFKPSEHQFVALANFLLSDLVEQAHSTVVGEGAERYTTCYQMLQDSQQCFSIERGFAILETTAQATGEYPTQFSMLALPAQERIYFSVKRAYYKQFEFSFETGIVQTYAGFAESREHNLSRRPILLSELAQW